jgi:Resolvase, N terminal domain/Helix-turn-helix domain of resolvase
MLCILYVRNGERYGGLRIREGEHRRSISLRPISRTQSREMRQDISGEDQRRAVRPQATHAPDGGPRKGDVLIVTRLDRLARSTRDLLNLLGTIAEKGAGFKSLRDTWADTTTAHGRLMLTVLGGLAEFERELIRTRTGEGRERAKARGVVLGRKPKLSPHQRREALARREAGEVLTDIARTYNVSHSTISRL